MAKVITFVLLLHFVSVITFCGVTKYQNGHIIWDDTVIDNDHYGDCKWFELGLRILLFYVIN